MYWEKKEFHKIRPWEQTQNHVFFFSSKYQCSLSRLQVTLNPGNKCNNQRIETSGFFCLLVCFFNFTLSDSGDFSERLCLFVSPTQVHEQHTDGKTPADQSSTCSFLLSVDQSVKMSLKLRRAAASGRSLWRNKHSRATNHMKAITAQPVDPLIPDLRSARWTTTSRLSFLRRGETLTWNGWMFWMTVFCLVSMWAVLQKALRSSETCTEKNLSFISKAELIFYNFGFLMNRWVFVHKCVKTKKNKAQSTYEGALELFY